MLARTALILTVIVTAAPAVGQTASDARDILAAAIQDPDAGRLAATLLALRSTRDKDLAPLLEALSRSGDRNRRHFAVEALVDLAPDQAAPALLERLKTDPEKAIRHRVLLHLLDLKAISAADLAGLLTCPDESLQCFAARGLIARGQGKQAAETLRKLADSQDQAIVAMARMGLLATGEAGQLPELRGLLGDPKTPAVVLGLVLEQIAEARSAAGLELAELVIASGREGPLRLRAWEAVAAVAPDAAARLRHALETCDDTVMQVHLVNVLAVRADAAEHLAALAKRSDAGGLLARFELARGAAGPDARQSAARALALGHPVVVDYVLNRARADVAARPAQSEFYVPALLEYVRSVKPDSSRMGPDQNRTAVAASLLADIGSKAAMDGLREVLSGRYGPTVRAAAAGLRWSGNRAACELARPLLVSPYVELAEDAALLLGKFGDRDAAGALRNVLARRDTRPPALVALAAWYLLRIEGSTATATSELCRLVR